MLLAIDAGNTNTVFALFDGAVLRGMWRMAADAERTSDEYAAFLTPMMLIAGLTPDDVHEAVLGSVVPDANFNLLKLCRDHFKTEPLHIGQTPIDVGMQIKIDRPEELGADRLLNALAARAAHKPPLMIVDFGTATTFDLVDANGDYCGGAIAPGANLSLKALHMAAAKLPRVAMARPQKVIGKATVPAIQSGIFWGYVGMVEGLITRLQTEFAETCPASMTVIATGGLAALFREPVPAIQYIEPDLTLRGLRLVFDLFQQEKMKR